MTPDALLPDSLRALVARVPVTPPNQDALILTPAQALKNAEALLVKASKASDFATMKPLLQTTQRAFATARNESGATAVFFLLSVLEKGTDTKTPTSHLERARAGQQRAVLQELSALPNKTPEQTQMLAALSFLLEPWDQAVDRVAALGPAHLQTLCREP